jgi:hypothetical protein
MDEIVLYTTDCPKCRILERKMKDKGLTFKFEHNMNPIVERGFIFAPVLQVGDKFMEFGEAVKWVNESEVG